MVTPSGTTAGRCFHPEAAGDVGEVVFLRTRATGSQCEGHSHLRRHAAAAGKCTTLPGFFVTDPLLLPPIG